MATPPTSSTSFSAPPTFTSPGIPGVQSTTLKPPTPKQPPCTTPSNTVYINNLNEKIKIPALKKALQTIFERYGEILDIVAHANFRMRGQAFVVFKEQESAAKAIKELNGFTLRDKQMLIQYARSKSDAIAKLDGTFEEHKKQRLDAKGKRAKEPPLKKVKREPGYSSGTSGSMYYGHQSTGSGGSGNIADEYLPPNKILFLQNLPEEDTTEALLTSLFQQYPGFKEVRMIPVKRSIAFVEYEVEAQAMLAKDALSNFAIDQEHKMKITFARK